MSTRIVLDCDTGVDDTMAIMYACLHPDIELLGVGAVWGNVDVETAARNSRTIVEACGRPEVPVAQGSAKPLIGDAAEIAYHVHGRDGQGNRGSNHVPGSLAPTTAAQQLVELCHRHPGEVEIVAVGPLTNVALALALGPDLARDARGITIMGGAALAPGNVSEVAEANIWHDPEAAAAVFEAPWRVTMVGLDVTMRTLLDEDHFARLRAGGTLARYMERIAQFYRQFFADESFGGEQLSCMHDCLAVAVAAGTVRVDNAPLTTVRVDSTAGPGRGQTLCDLRGMYAGFPPVKGARHRVVLDCDTSFGDAFVDLVVGAGDAHVDLSERSA